MRVLAKMGKAKKRGGLTLLFPLSEQFDDGTGYLFDTFLAYIIRQGMFEQILYLDL